MRPAVLLKHRAQRSGPRWFSSLSERVPRCALLFLAAATLCGQNKLIDAVKGGDAAAVRAALSQSPDLNATDATGATALHWAVQLDHTEIAEALIAAGVDVNATNRYNVTPMWMAATNGNARLIERLLDAGVDPNATAEEGQTALMTAALNGTPGSVRILLRRGAKVNIAEPNKGQTALMWAAAEGNAQAAALLIEFGADVHTKSKTGFTPLLFAVRNNRIGAARVLLDHGANVNDLAPNGTSALNMAIVNAFYEMGSVLLDFHADPNLPDERASPLHTIAWLRKPGANGQAGVGNTAAGPPNPIGNVTSLELAQKLLDHGADPNVRVTWTEGRFSKEGGTARNPPQIALGRHLLTFTGATAFYIAAHNGDIDYMRLLVKGGADPNIGTQYGITPLMVAAGMDYWEGETPGPHTGVSEKERLEAVKYALELGNPINARTNFGEYPMTGEVDYTLLYYPHNIDDLLMLGVGDPRWNGCTALHGAIISNQPGIVQYLVDHGAEVNIKNQLGWTPLLMSRGVFLANAKKEFPEIEKVLLKAGAR